MKSTAVHVGQGAVDDDDVGHVGNAHLDRVKPVAASMTSMSGAAENAFRDLPDDARIVDEHAALHFPVLFAMRGEPAASGIRMHHRRDLVKKPKSR